MRWFVFLLLFVIVNTHSFGDDPTPTDIRYVRSNAPPDGDGLSWATAWQRLPFVVAGGGSRISSQGALVRGYTYYIADGEYPEYVFDSTPDEEKVITIRKATQDDHGSSEGWDPSYGDGVAIFRFEDLLDTGNTHGSVFRVRSPYWVIDGAVGKGDGSEEAHGFKVTYHTPAGITAGANIIDLTRTSGQPAASYVELRHIEVDGGFAGDLEDLTQIVERTNAIYIPNPSGSPATDVNIRHCYLKNVTVCHLRLDGIRNSIVEYCYVENRIGGHYELEGGGTASIHGEAISANSSGLEANNTYRYNTFKNIRGTGIIVVKDSSQSHFYIYGNLLINTIPGYTTGNGAIANTSGDFNDYMYVYNNTFIGGFGGNFGVFFSGAGENNHVVNNLWADGENVSVSAIINTSHNAFWNTGASVVDDNKQVITSDPFVDYSEGDYLLTGPTEPGSVLSSPYNMDYFGNIRGEDGVWDRGAFEYVDSLSTPATPTPTITPTPSTPTPATPSPTPTGDSLYENLFLTPRGQDANTSLYLTGEVDAYRNGVFHQTYEFFSENAVLYLLNNVTELLLKWGDIPGYVTPEDTYIVPDAYYEFEFISVTGMYIPITPTPTPTITPTPSPDTPTPTPITPSPTPTPTPSPTLEPISETGEYSIVATQMMGITKYRVEWETDSEGDVFLQDVFTGQGSIFRSSLWLYPEPFTPDTNGQVFLLDSMPQDLFYGKGEWGDLLSPSFGFQGIQTRLLKTFETRVPITNAPVTFNGSLSLHVINAGNKKRGSVILYISE